MRIATQYFILEKGACPGDPIIAYPFKIILKIIFALIKSRELINGADILDILFGLWHKLMTLFSL